MDEALVKRLKASWRLFTNILTQPIESLKWGETGEITKIRVDMADKQEIGRPMKFPYTFTAKVAQFPWKFYFTRQWIWKYYAISLVVCLPVFAKISKLGNALELPRIIEKCPRLSLPCLIHFESIEAIKANMLEELKTIPQSVHKKCMDDWVNRWHSSIALDGTYFEANSPENVAKWAEIRRKEAQEHHH